MKEDHIAATKAYDAYGAYCDGETSPALRRLLAAFDEEDGEENIKINFYVKLIYFIS